MRTGFKVFLILVIIGILGESLLRAGLWAFPQTFQNANWYFDWSSEDAYWRYRSAWTQQVESSQKQIFDSVLGWDMESEKKGEVVETVWLGDNFLREFSPVLAEELGEGALNGSVTGYGWDQIALKAKRLSAQYPAARLVIGLSSQGLDRSLLSFRTGLKPYYELEGKELQLKGVPLSKGNNLIPWWESFFVHWLVRQVDRGLAANELETQRYRERKKELNRKIMQDLVATLKKNQIRFTGVSFFSKPEMNYQGWREKFIKQEIAPLFPEFFNSKSFLQGTLDPNAIFDEEGVLSREARQKIILELQQASKQI